MEKSDNSKSYKTQNQNARVQKWQQIIESKQKINFKTMIQEVRLGIPSSMRMLVWEKIVNTNGKQKVNCKFEQLIDKQCQSIKCINLDVKRTFPDDKDHQMLQPSLYNLLKAITLAYPKVGYKSGMSFLAYRMLEIVNQETALNLWGYLFIKYPQFKQISQERSKIGKIKYAFERILQQKIPAVFKNAQQIFQMLMQHFLTLGSYKLRKNFFLRVFDLFLAQGWSVIFSILIQFIFQNRKQLAGAYQKGTFKQIQIFTKINEFEDYQQLIESSWKLNITSEKIDQLFANYQQNNA